MDPTHDQPDDAPGSRRASQAESRRSSKATKEKKGKIDLNDWDAAMPEMDTGPPWDSLSSGQKALRVTINTLKICGVFALLYLFICSLTLLGDSFRLISGPNASKLASSSLTQNPVVGLIIGILLTVLLQSSSTSTSIIVSMVSAQILTVTNAIPIIMGCNVGTSVTNTLVSLTQVANRAIFRRAFAGGTVHDMFNWLSVMVLLTVEEVTRAAAGQGVFEYLTEKTVNAILGTSAKGGSVKILTVITDPFTNHIVELDEQVMNCWTLGYWKNVTTIMKRYCDVRPMNSTTTTAISTAISTATATTVSAMNATLSAINTTVVTTIPTTIPTTTLAPTTAPPHECPKDVMETPDGMIGIPDSCDFLFYNKGLKDLYVGLILLAFSLALMSGCLIGIVKLLNSMLYGTIAKIIKTTLNSNIPYVPWLTGYIAIMVGAVMTFIIQSSSVFTSILTPLIGLGILTVERAFPLTLGSNIGTTTTALIASLASPPSGLKNAVQIALVHLYFNVIGICIWYPIPFMRLPIVLCKILGNITAQYRWFAIVYLVVMFLLFPIAVFGLSYGAGDLVMGCILGPIFIFILILVAIYNMQHKCPQVLPPFLRSWDWLPEWMHSLEPYDRMITGMPCCAKCRDDAFESDSEDEELSVVVSRKSSTKFSEGNHRDSVAYPRKASHISKSSKSSKSSKASSVCSGHDNKAMELETMPVPEVSTTRRVSNVGHDNEAMEHHHEEPVEKVKENDEE